MFFCGAEDPCPILLSPSSKPPTDTLVYETITIHGNL